MSQWGQKRMSIFQIPETVCHWMQNAVSESERQEVHRNDIPAPWVTPVITCSLRCHKPVNMFASASNQTTWVSHWSPMRQSHLERYCPTSSTEELEGVYEVVMAVRQHVSVKPGFPRMRLRLNWVCVTSRIAGRGQAVGRVGWVTLMRPGSVGFFHPTLKYTYNARAQGCTRTHAAVVSLLLPLIPLQHMQTSSRSCWGCKWWD